MDVLSVFRIEMFTDHHQAEALQCQARLICNARNTAFQRHKTLEIRYTALKYVFDISQIRTALLIQLFIQQSLVNKRFNE